MLHNHFIVQAALVASTFSHLGLAFWRLPCQARSGLARIDPIQDPENPSGHVHAIHGAGNLGFSSTSESLRTANCTSCEVSQDRSGYWTPALYFQYANGTFELVDQVGGMLAYYLIRNATSGFSGVQGFPDGFQLIAGNSTRRTFDQPVPDPPQSLWTASEMTQSALEQKAIGFNCLNYAATPEPSLYRHFMPDKAYLDANCLDGIRLELAFPSCWDGVHATSPDHQSHMAYPNLVVNGDCPAGYPARLVTLFYETIWNTYAFLGVPGQFVLSNGDTTGYGYHGDFMMGWDPDFLQSAVDTCTNLSGEVSDCPLFASELQSLDQQGSCQIPTPSLLAGENATEPGDILLGDDPITGVDDSLIPGEPALPSSSTNSSPTSLSAAMSASLGATQTATNVPTLSQMPVAKVVGSAALTSTITQSASTTQGDASPPYVTFWSTAGDVVYEDLVEVEEVTIPGVVTSIVPVRRRAQQHRYKHVRRYH